ncbi:unnamed protein product, partial [Brachionus calyciflorus]
KCVDYSKYGEKCGLTWHCDQKQVLSCKSSICGCSDTKFWSSDINKCVEKVSHGQSCNGDQCRINVNLHCSSSGSCECTDNNLYYWSEAAAACLPKKRYSQTCESNNECLNSDLTICKDDKYCLCEDSKYFTGFSCQTRVEEFESCLNNGLTFDDKCRSPMYCDSVNGCKCVGYYYFDEVIGNCVDMVATSGGKCEKLHHCRTDLKLECDLTNKKCVCQTGYTWSATQKECKLTYLTNVMCGSNSDCNLSEDLVCLTSLTNSCNCPTLSQLRRCDCVRTTSMETYWDDSLSIPKCVPAKVYSSECTESYECKTKIEKTMCIDEKCDCEQPGGWLAAQNICKKCKTNDIFFGTKCYHFSTGTSSGNSANSRCYDYARGTLIKIDSNDLIEFVLDNTDPGQYWVNGRRRGDDSDRWYSYIGSDSALCSTLCQDLNDGGNRYVNFKHENNGDGCYNSGLPRDSQR